MLIWCSIMVRISLNGKPVHVAMIALELQEARIYLDNSPAAHQSLRFQDEETHDQEALWEKQN